MYRASLVDRVDYGAIDKDEILRYLDSEISALSMEGGAQWS